MDTRLKNLRTILDRTQGRADASAETRKRLQKEIETATADGERLEKARAVLQEVVRQTQELLEFRLSSLVTSALQSIFPRPYTFRVIFEPKRGQTEARFTLIDAEGNERDPIGECGGGVSDIVSFALRLSLWALRTPRPRSTIILDEPFRFVSRDLLPKALPLLKELSRSLGLQFIVVTHEQDLVDEADKLFRVSQEGGVSVVRVPGEQMLEKRTSKRRRID